MADAGHVEGLTKAAWPSFDANVAKAEEVVVPVQINGKVRARLTVRATPPRMSCASWRSPTPESGITRREDHPQSRGREGPACERRRPMTEAE